MNYLNSDILEIAKNFKIITKILRKKSLIEVNGFLEKYLIKSIHK